MSGTDRYARRALDGTRTVMAGYLGCPCQIRDLEVTPHPRVAQALDEGYSVSRHPVTCPKHGDTTATIIDPTVKARPTA